MSPHDWFYSRLAKLPSPKVVEIGTKAWDGKPPRHHRDVVHQYNPRAQWTGVDIEAGEGVDVVCDAHYLSSQFSDLDAWLCMSTLEHLRRPWVVARELAKVTKPGGIGLIATHFAFPYHPYSGDYFRFSIEGMREVFAEDLGWDIPTIEYHNPCKVVPLGNFFAHATDWNFEGEAWLTIAAAVQRK